MTLFESERLEHFGGFPVTCRHRFWLFRTTVPILVLSQKIESPALRVGNTVICRPTRQLLVGPSTGRLNL